MFALLHEPSARRAVTLVAAEPESPWAARGFADLVPPATVAEARERRDELAGLLGRERAAAADFLLALSDFDRRRGWERLGHASLFAFLTRELRLSSGAAQLRLSAARLLPRHPAVEAALRGGQLCISAVGQLARVLTEENEGAVLPRFFGRSAREAAEVAAALLPCPSPPRREVVTALPARSPESVRVSSAPAAASLGLDLTASERPQAATLAPGLASAPLHTCEVPAPACASPRAQGEPPRRLESARSAEVEPLTADLRRLHLTVSRMFMEKVAAAKTGLSHAAPRATTEQVLEAALDLLLERQARRKALVRRPWTPRPTPTPRASQRPALRPGRPTAARPHIPAAIEREVRLRDGDRCQFTLDAGGPCGSTWQVELDHIIPLALGGPTTVANLRCACRFHNMLAAQQVLGEAALAAARRGRVR
jgi:5-methylcytosine-specific restriction endonuclease McrA